jgi:hypothetical protein
MFEPVGASYQVESTGSSPDNNRGVPGNSGNTFSVGSGTRTESPTSHDYLCGTCVARKPEVSERPGCRPSVVLSSRGVRAKQSGEEQMISMVGIDHVLADGPACVPVVQ